MYSRLDLVKNQTGLALAENFEVLPHGPVVNRPGFVYVNETKYSGSLLSCLIPFVFSTTQSMVLEFGHSYIRFHTDGGTLLEASKVITGITAASPAVLTVAAHGYATGEWVYVDGITDGPVELNRRFYKVVLSDANNIRLTDLAGNAIDSTALGAWVAGGTVSRVYEIASPYADTDVFNLHYTQSEDVLTLVHPAYQQRELRRLGATNWQLTTLSFAPTIAAPAAPTLTVSGGGGTEPFEYVVTAIAESTLEESLPSPVASITNDLTTPGNYTGVTITPVPGAVRYNVYRALNGLFGFIAQTGGDPVLDENIVPDTGITPPITDDVMNAAGRYPQAVGYFQGRRWFAGPTDDPQRAFASKAGTESNFTYAIPQRDDDRLSFRIRARQANTIRHIVPLEEPVLLTSGGAFVVQGNNTSVLTGATLDPRPKGTVGASNVQPAITESSVVYAYDRGNRLREFAFRGDTNGGYRGQDLSIMAPHLFDGFTTLQLSYSLAPYPNIWGIRNDGALFGCTYVPEQQVAAMHTHTTAGVFESVCVVPENRTDVPYVIVVRTVQGRFVRYIERKASRQFTALQNCCFLDSSVIYTGAAANAIGGLHHLEGAAVNALAAGAVFKNLTVTGGKITLPDGLALTPVIAGLPIDARLQTLPLITEAAPAAGQGIVKNISDVTLRVFESSGLRAGTSFDRLYEYKQRTTEPYGTPPALMTKAAVIGVDGAWSDDAQVCIEQLDPLPVTLLSITVKATLGD